MTHHLQTESRHGVPVTSKQAEIYDWIVARIRAQGFPPTIREIGAQFGITSPNGVRCHLKALSRKRLIELSPMTARGIRVVDKSPTAWAHRVGNDVWLMDGPTAAGATRIGTLHYERFVQLAGVELNGVPVPVRVSRIAERI